MSQKRSIPVRSAVVLAVSVLACGAAVAAAQPSAERARVIVAFKAGKAEAVRAAVARLGGKVAVDLADANAIAVTLPKAAVARLKAQAGVEFVENDTLQTIQGKRSAKALAGVRTAAGTETVPYGIKLVQADQVSGTPKWTPKVCIIDSGIDGRHEDLAGNRMVGKNFSGSGDWNTDESAHGTHVAGTIAALDNDVGVVGVNADKQVSLAIAKVFDASGSAASSVIAKAMLACGVAKANIVSMSLGGSTPNKLQQRVVDALTAKGVLFIAASGNAGTTAISYPAGFSNVMSVAAVDENKAWASFSQYNADVEIAAPGVAVVSTIPPGIESRGLLSVGAASYPVNAIAGSPRATATAPLADFGLGDQPAAGKMTGKVCLISRGSISFADKVLNCQTSGGLGAIIYNNADGPLLATLGETVTTIPSVGATQADGSALLAKVGDSATVTVEADPAKYAAFDGTSMATPHVSGVAALVWAHNPSCNAQQIRATLVKSALDIGAAGRDDKTGAGLVQAKAAIDRIAALGCGN